MNSNLQAMMTSWQPIAPLVSVPYTESQYQKRIALLNELIDEVGENEVHPLATLLDIVGMAVANYEQAHYPIPAAPPQDVLAYLMAEHQLKQTDLPEMGSQGVVSEILRGKRQLNVRQIQALSQRFRVSAEVFLAVRAGIVLFWCESAIPLNVAVGLSNRQGLFRELHGHAVQAAVLMHQGAAWGGDDGVVGEAGT